MLVVSSRLALLADEVIYQKRMSLIQSVLLLVCILVVIFSKSSQLDAPLIHSIRGRASTLFESPPNSPPLPSKDGTTIRRLLTRRDSSFRRDSMDSSLQSPLQSPTQLQLSPPISELAEPTSISSPPTPTGRRGTDVEDISGDGPADWREFGSDLRVTELAGRRWHRLPSPLGSSATLDDGTDREGDGEEGYKFEHRGIQEVFQGRNGGNLHHNINNTAVLSPPSSPSPPPSMLSSTSSILTNKPRQKARSSTPQPQSSSQDQSQTSPNLGLMSPTSPKSGAQFGHSRSNSNTKNKRKKKK